MTRTELKELTHFYLNELGVSRIKDSDADEYDLNQALFHALERYFRETRCSLVNYTLAATASKAIYSFGAFGQESADDDAVSVSATAGSGALTLVAGEPDVTVNPSHWLTVTIKNSGTGAQTGLATNFTIVGTLESGAAYTEVVAFTLAELTAVDEAATRSHTTINAFATVNTNGITQSVGQPTGAGKNWQRYVGVAAEDRAKRIFDLSYVSYDESPLTRRERDFMDGWSQKWRTSDNGTPTVWLAWGDKQLRLWRPPDGTDNIYIEGWQTPDSRVLADDTQEPPIETTEQEILAMHAAIIVTIRDSANEQLVRQSALWPQVQRGWQRAYQRIHGAGDRTIIFGRGNPAIRSDWPPVSETIITI